MKNWEQNILPDKSTIKEALTRLNEIGIANNVLFVVNENNVLKGSVTDGDIRRGLLNNKLIEEAVLSVMNPNCRRIKKNSFENSLIKQYRENGIIIIPVVDEDGRIVNILNLNQYKRIIPVDAVIMAGGKGERLLPITENQPKPLVKVGDQPIIEYNIDNLIKYGVQHLQISVNYLGEKISDYFKDGSGKGISIKYITEKKPLGTIGSVTMAEPFVHETVLLMNSDLLTNIDFGDLYDEFVKSNADMVVASIPHHVDLPYAILELQDNLVSSLHEKPRYTYFANAGIYLFKKELLKYIPRGEFYDATDLMEKIIQEGRKLVHFPILGYWLDIGNKSDFEKAQHDYKHIKW
jgi:dTDP-glucose pyrophosphorylase